MSPHPLRGAGFLETPGVDEDRNFIHGSNVTLALLYVPELERSTNSLLRYAK
jgi:hypothetical protein